MHPVMPDLFKKMSESMYVYWDDLESLLFAWNGSHTVRVFAISSFPVAYSELPSITFMDEPTQDEVEDRIKSHGMEEGE
jgi:hypothetical protein